MEFHFGCDFKPVAGELVIVDEIDILMYKDPIKFNETIEGCLVLGFTATPDNFKPSGAERRIFSLLKFQKFDYILDQQDQKELDLTFDEVMKYESDLKKVEFIVK